MNPKSPIARLRAESAVAAYIRNFYDPNADEPSFDKLLVDVKCRRENTPLDQIQIIEGQSPVMYSLPCVVVNAPGARPVVAGDMESGMTEVRVEVHVLTHLNEGQNNSAAQAHADRLGQVMALMTDDEDQVMTSLSGDDALVPDLKVFGFWLEDEVGAQNELHWDDTLVFMLHCCAFNST